MTSEDAMTVAGAINRLTDAVKELVTLVAKHAEEPAAITMPPEDFSVPPPAPIAPPTAAATAAKPKTDLTAVPPVDALCRCMHMSQHHVDGVVACTKTGCSCQKFEYMVAPKPTPGSCTGCGCTPAQVKMVPDTTPPICVTCKATADALKRPKPSVPA